jgi:DNA end-binding protein Ku
MMGDNLVREKVFSVIRDAVTAADRVGTAWLVLCRRGRSVMLAPGGCSIVLMPLRHGGEVREPDLDFGYVRTEKHGSNLASLVATLIEEKSNPWHSSMVCDPIPDQTVEIVALKKKRKHFPKPKAARDRSHNHVNIMDALRESVAP